MTAAHFWIRKATWDDLDAMLRMQARSMRALGRDFYGAETIESALQHIGTMDPEVIDEGNFYVAVTRDGKIIGSGGWSRRVPGYDRIQATPAPASPPRPDAAVIRSVFVNPEWTRQGIATSIMNHAETTVVDAGVPEVVLTATLSGVPLYRALGYRALRPKRIRFPDGIVFDAVEMSKQLGGRRCPRGTKQSAKNATEPDARDPSRHMLTGSEIRR